MTLSDLENWDTRVKFFQAGLLNNAHTICPRTTKFAGNTCGEGLFLRESNALTARGRGPSAPNV